ncbi:phosphate/phosphite/phosphonate ABC transporter substrate-binding protein [Sulfuriflexus sp.]|uniref:phosphate/phosphite/phosphonate ABC transporter substrate-binding protein n=1 Tax=Sulfuriflexus sp. TaxID=2015443 RepID=UPI0028CD4AE9|nr:PhnD/SsuA/transferrin family substrate-binding protein [Sulfuriflexus sp.]MDT8403687.1 PhnD/SsuA/transferrin family substrate-binding protein [Sulfuriflexus sp.]
MLKTFYCASRNRCRKGVARAGFFLGACLMIPVMALAAEDGVITMTTAPTQSVADTHKLYGPIAEYLSAASGKQVKLVPVRNFLEYTSKMRKDEFDIIFDGPHFVSWRMQHTNHVPMARLPGELVFMAAVKDGGAIKQIDQLIGKKICAVNSPNLATLMVLDAFPNPVRQPVIVAQNSFKAAMQCLKEGKGMAAILPIKFWKKFEKKGETRGYRLLYSTRQQPLPPRTFSISMRIDAETREKITKALLESEGKPGALPVLNRFRSKNFVAARESEYHDLSRLLLSVWGFHE